MADSALQRKNMVESQVRPSDVTDRRITGAMQDVQRERFVPARQASLAYMDEALAVAPGRSLMAPRTFARLLQLADVQPGDKVLIIGALQGYSTAVIARLARAVVAVERDGELATAARSAVADSKIANAVIVSGPLTAGYPASAPYDVIFVEGAIESLPAELTAQLSPAGRLVAIENSGGLGRAIVMQASPAKAGATVSRRIAFDAAGSLLPGFEQPKAFKF